MKKDIILAGVGGQGILSIAVVIGVAARNMGLNVRQSEVHGMSQRGGEVQAHLRLSSHPIATDLITEGTADLIIGMEPLESVRYINYLSLDGWLVTNSTPFINIDNYPEDSLVLDFIRQFPNHLLVDAERIARKLGSVKSSNMVLLGACLKFLGLKIEHIESAIDQLFGDKGERMLKINREALSAGQNTKEDISAYAF
jgi:indolepyruvate ferredoxin oxidoreductase beta subunit